MNLWNLTFSWFLSAVSSHAIPGLLALTELWLWVKFYVLFFYGMSYGLWMLDKSNIQPIIWSISSPFIVCFTFYYWSLCVPFVIFCSLFLFLSLSICKVIFMNLTLTFVMTVVGMYGHAREYVYMEYTFRYTLSTQYTLLSYSLSFLRTVFKIWSFI